MGICKYNTVSFAYPGEPEAVKLPHLYGRMVLFAFEFSGLLLASCPVHDGSCNDGNNIF